MVLSAKTKGTNKDKGNYETENFDLADKNIESEEHNEAKEPYEIEETIEVEKTNDINESNKTMGTNDAKGINDFKEMSMEDDIHSVAINEDTDNNKVDEMI